MTAKTISCDMEHTCTAPVTHIGNKGYIYCAHHAAIRHASTAERCRKMRVWECAYIAEGKQISYAPRPKPAEGESL